MFSFLIFGGKLGIKLQFGVYILGYLGHILYQFL